MFWQLHSFPPCQHHVFLSHCRENHDALVKPVYDALVADGLTPWLDREDYYYGRDSRTALRDGVLRSRHVVFFVTRDMITTGRGWCVFELAYAELLQGALSYAGGVLANVVLPLFFVPQSDPELPRTVWQVTRDRGRFHDPAVDGDPVGWSCREILRFLRDEQQLATDLRTTAARDRPFREGLRKQRPGLYERVTRVDPAPIPEHDP